MPVKMLQNCEEPYLRVPIRGETKRSLSQCRPVSVLDNIEIQANTINSPADSLLLHGVYPYDRREQGMLFRTQYIQLNSAVRSIGITVHDDLSSPHHTIICMRTMRFNGQENRQALIPRRRVA